MSDIQIEDLDQIGSQTLILNQNDKVNDDIPSVMQSSMKSSTSKQRPASFVSIEGEGLMRTSQQPSTKSLRSESKIIASQQLLTVINSGICSIHQVKSKYICIQKDCFAESRLACAECHVEGPHPKHELIRREHFLDDVAAKATQMNALLNAVDLEPARELIQKNFLYLKEQFLSSLQAFQAQQSAQLDVLSSAKQDMLSSSLPEGGGGEEENRNNSPQILKLLSQSELDFSNLRLTTIALSLYHTESIESIETVKAKFNRKLEDMIEKIQNLQKRLVSVFDENQKASQLKQSQIQTLDNGSYISRHSSQHFSNNNPEKSSCPPTQRENQTDQLDSQLQTKLQPQHMLQQQPSKEKVYRPLTPKPTGKSSSLPFRGVCAKQFKEHKGWIGRIEQITADIFASTSSDGRVLFWSMKDKILLQDFSWDIEEPDKYIAHSPPVEADKPSEPVNQLQLDNPPSRRVQSKLPGTRPSSSPNSRPSTSSHRRHHHILSLCLLDENTLALGGSDKLIRIYQYKNHQIVKQLKGHKGGVNYCLKLSPTSLVSCSSDKSIIVWDWHNKVILNQLSNHHNDAIYMVISLHSSEVIASCSKDCLVKVYDFERKTVTAALTGAKQPVHAICYLKRNVLAAGGVDSAIRIWNYASGVQIRIIVIPLQQIFALCRIDEKYIVSGQSDNKVTIWAYEEGEQLENSIDSRHGYGAECVASLQAHSSSITCIKYLPESMTLLTGSNDFSICMWK